MASTASTVPAVADAAKPAKKKIKWSSLPEIWALLHPRRGVLLLGLVLVAINRVSGLVLPGSSKYLFDNVIDKHQVRLLLPIVLAVVGATLLQGITSFTLTQLLSKSAQRMITEMRKQVQAHIGRLPVAYYDANKTGVLVSRIMSDVEGIRNLIGTGLVEFVGGVLTAILALIILLRTSAMMTLVAFTVLVGFALFLNKAFAAIRPIFRARPKINAEVTGRLTESLGGVRVVKGYHAEEREEQVFASGAQRLLDNVLKTLTTTSLMSLSGAALMGIVSAIIIYLGARQVLTGAMTKGDLIAYSAYLVLMVAPVFQIVNIGTQITEAITGLERTREVLSESKEDQDPKRTRTLGRINGIVEFQDVRFSYEPAKEVLHGISFLAEPGTVTALVGPSGSGKSTIIGLLSAFYVPTQGQILVDGIDLATVRLDSYRTQLGVVLQETFLFDGTIRENVAYARPDASEEEIMAACRIARVDEFAEQFEKKYDTVVGERGVRLSGGQKQRVSIARALLADPRILILDEATSSLDSESEALIQEGLRYLMRGRTTFVIAHRLSTIRRAEQILVVQEGKILERGTHQSLYALQGRYFELYNKQHAVETNLFLAPGEGDKTEESNDNNGTASAGGALPEAIRMIRTPNP
ncbi:MAG TPA: ABC transporter ATP-binding protein [Candidatus Eremiobacteraceae bacterium]|nr:ABC transporter ATP-binding protein [Candidatus Eremiobacteraceae bacterium]